MSSIFELVKLSPATDIEVQDALYHVWQENGFRPKILSHKEFPHEKLEDINVRNAIFDQLQIYIVK